DLQRGDVFAFGGEPAADLERFDVAVVLDAQRDGLHRDLHALDEAEALAAAGGDITRDDETAQRPADLDAHRPVARGGDAFEPGLVQAAVVEVEPSCALSGRDDGCLNVDGRDLAEVHEPDAAGSVRGHR